VDASDSGWGVTPPRSTKQDSGTSSKEKNRSM
jgi:hypothetical protein